LPAVDFDDCLLGVCENAGTENDAEIAAAKNAIEMISTNLFIGIPPSLRAFLYLGQPNAATGGAGQKQPFLHHVRAHPISAAFTLRYIHTSVRRWGASGRAPVVHLT
jgi:hypothetical protein